MQAITNSFIHSFSRSIEDADVMSNNLSPALTHSLHGAATSMRLQSDLPDCSSSTSGPGRVIDTMRKTIHKIINNK